MKIGNLSFDSNHNIKIDGRYLDIRNNYNIESLKVDVNIVFSIVKDKFIIDSNPHKIDFSFFEVSQLEIDFKSFSSLEQNKLYFDDLLVVPLKYKANKLSLKDKPFHNRQIDNDVGFIDSNYIDKYKENGDCVDFKISTKNGIDFYFIAKRFEIIIY